MRNTFTSRSLALFALLAATGCCSNPEAKTVMEVPGSVANTASPAPTVVAEAPAGNDGDRKPQIVGGYTRREVSDAEIAAVARQAIELLSAKEGDATLLLVSIESAASQVVAGMNFALELKVKGKAGERTLEVVIYRDLKDHASLTKAAAK
jgi:hypothetical protein